jgi:hypothetical protein
MTFRVGQKVVCINADGTHLDGIQELIKGEIYTIARCWRFVPSMLLTLMLGGISPYVGVSLHERGPRIWPLTGEDIPFSAERFRPLVERKSQTDISIFKKMLDGQSKRVKEPERA